MSSKLDQIVKGAAPPTAHIPEPILGTTGVHPSDPTLHLPSSPPQIYLNLLILEASLRSQYLELRARRRQHTFFLSLLSLWIGYFTYALFLAPREDGHGLGGSIYWVLDAAYKLALGGGIITALLVWGTGQWERGVRWPRRWVGTTNRGLRGFNLKVVVVRKRWWTEWSETVNFFVAGGLLHNNGSSTYKYVPPALAGEGGAAGAGRGSKGGSRDGRSGLPGIAEHPASGREEDLSPGGDTIALLLLPKPFSPSFRENWDLYRTEYWDKENERRKVLLKKVREYEKAERRKVRWWKRWFWPSALPKERDVEKHGHGHGHHSKNHLSVPGEKRLRPGSVRSGSHSRTPSRSTTPLGHEEHNLTEGESRGHSRRSSTASNRSKPRMSSSLTPTSSVREKNEREKGTGVSGRTRGSSIRTHSGGQDARPTTPGEHSDSGSTYIRRSLLWEGAEGNTLKRDSFMSDASTESARDELRKEKRDEIEERKKEEARKEETARRKVRTEQSESIAQRVKENAKGAVEVAAEEAMKEKSGVREEDIKP